MVVGNLVPLIFDTENDIYNKNGINFNSLIHLKSIGLIHFENNSSITQKFPKKFAVSYREKLLVLTMQNENTLDIGQVLFTKIGEELVKISQSPGIVGFYEYVEEKWKAHIPDDKEPNKSDCVNPHVL